MYFRVDFPVKSGLGFKISVKRKYQNKGWQRCFISPKNPCDPSPHIWKYLKIVKLCICTVWSHMSIYLTCFFSSFSPLLLYLFLSVCPSLLPTKKQKHTGRPKPHPCDFLQSFLMTLIINWSRECFWLFKECEERVKATIFTFSQDPCKRERRQAEPHSHSRCTWHKNFLHKNNTTSVHVWH